MFEAVVPEGDIQKGAMPPLTPFLVTEDGSEIRFSAAPELDKIRCTVDSPTQSISLEVMREDFERLVGACQPNLEIERRFLVRKIPDISVQSTEHIQQYYLIVSHDDDGPVEVRIRSSEKGLILGIKRGAGMIRREDELRIVSALSSEILGVYPSVEKVRERFEVNGIEIELNRFKPPCGIDFLYEVEFPSEESSRAFTPPVFFGEEVTDNPACSGAALAVIADR